MDTTSMGPMIPEESTSRLLEDDVLALVAEANRLAGRIHPILLDSIGDLVRSMNCYYSNLIEGHDTHPRDIDRALANDFSTEPKKRDLQKEAVAHIHVQRLIDTGRDPDTWPASASYASCLHEAFCSRLPPEMLFVADEKTGARIEIVPGEWRKRHVQVGRHIPPPHEDLPRFMSHFDMAYGSPPLSRARQLQTVGAVHHRLLWIHPFLDGNGRVARLMSHALFKRLEVGTNLWSVARGLARDEARYKGLLAQADSPREGDLDGRGNLIQRGLIEFCKFFLDRSVDQIRFMSGLLDPATLLTRIEIHLEEEVRAVSELRSSLLTSTE
jgi:Fic family protein